MHTPKGLLIREKILSTLNRNPDGLKFANLNNNIPCSRNTLYKYLNQLELEKVIERSPDKIYSIHHNRLRSRVSGHQYQAILQGIAKIGGENWNIQTIEGQNKYKQLGKAIFPKLKHYYTNLNELSLNTLHKKDLFIYIRQLLGELKCLEEYHLESKIDSKTGFPDPYTQLVATISLQGTYLGEEVINGNGYAHYFIQAGIFESFLDYFVTPLYGGKGICDIIDINSSNSTIRFGLYVIFDDITPYHDPQTIRNHNIMKHSLEKRKKKKFLVY
ncbi:hypothetical protein [Candidatus Lokiarchaeum ossiferum]|uniref:hypothetical protein n=1 Tax=Candidatus Lokiarchaeum ossiferum TaxID=2951803 RepID=UPI00352C3EB2